MSAPPAINGKALPIRLLIAMPPHTTNTPNAIVKSTWPAPATPVTASVFGFFQCCARAAITNGSQCVGMAAWRNATVAPVTTRVMKTRSFISETSHEFENARRIDAPTIVATLVRALVHCSRGHDFSALLRNRPAMVSAPIHRLDSHDRRLFKKRVAVPSNCQNTWRCAPVFSLSDRQQGQNGGKEIRSPTSDAEARHDLSGKRNHSSPVLRTFQLRDY